MAIFRYKNKLWVKMPKNKFFMPEKVFLNAETYDMGRKTDKTAWRMVTRQMLERLRIDKTDT
jgi:hypothetical protein